MDSEHESFTNFSERVKNIQPEIEIFFYCKNPTNIASDGNQLTFGDGNNRTDEISGLFTKLS